MWLVPVPLLLLLIGCCTLQAQITGPKTARGQEQGSLTVQCRYDSGFKTYGMYWCRGADWSSCKILVTTDGTEKLVKKDRVSIRDNQTDFTFTVTMEDLRRSDAGIYWCAIERTGADYKFKVSVTIDPASTTVSTTLPTTSTTNTAPAVTKETNVLPTITSRHSDGRQGIMELTVLLPVISVLLLLFLVVASLFAWRMMRQQKKKATRLPPEQVLQSLEGDVCYANLTLKKPRTFPDSSVEQASTKPSSPGQVEVDYISMAPLPREVYYTTLSLAASDQEPTYSNTGHLITHVPSSSHEESTEYSVIKKP